ncbi:hypothetical protein QCA50_011388 [Cerrena zonata]|uniref:Uncharacterized protein n=1 Tax=Cerrena zonata TaxID=2478898 RepID=A0AAW0FZI2_9APHY
MSHLLAKYPAAITDFYGSGTPCVYKTGPVWPVAQGPQSQKIRRAARPIYKHGIAPIWLDTAWSIVAELETFQVDWNAVDPLAYANAGQAALIWEFVITIGVKPLSLVYETAVAAAKVVDGILEAAGFPEIQVAFIESVYRRQGKLMSFDPTYELQGIPGLRKPFTPTLGLANAPYKSPYYEGTGGLYLRLNTDESDKRTVLLTCAHVAHPPPLFDNKEYTRKFGSQLREDIILLGGGSFNDSVEDIMKFIGDQSKAIASWETHLRRIPEPAEGEAVGVTAKRKELTDLIAAAKDKIRAVNELHSHVTKNHTTTASRIFGFVLHCAKIEVGSDGFMYDWALIQIDDDRVEMKDLKGNQVFVGGNKTAIDWENYMFAQLHDRHDFHVPDDLLLHIQDYVREAEFRDPHNYDVHNVKTLLAVKNGRTTGTTFGRVNGLESITRHYPEHGIEVKAVEIVVCSYDTKTGENDKFSDEGDSGRL